ncbi:HipA family kinase [Anabaena catenula]|uniref:HipA-like kinase domain-containing protein n=1 Tax=Anabaena catenula FACHB-362 TaxID=2692877 RepID=A0ABR8J274_9NOST|nr:HipA family kinase [Anabaena catenula]MBD2691949.1 hypothetical protein [Anabaena catenula FACHB-362]
MNNEINIEEDRARWKLSLEKLLKNPEEPVLITTLLSGWNSAARPVRAKGIDNCDYVVKGQQAGRQIINDQIVARLGLAMGAPVGKPQIVEISPELLELDPEFAFLAPGKAHATHFIRDCLDDHDMRKYKDHTGNRERFALLSVLFGWVYSQDQQFIYQKAHPCLVYSVDHGHFFPSGPDWTAESLNNASEAKPDQRIVSVCSLKDNEIRQALSVLETVTEEMIIQAVVSPPNEWGITMNERITMLEFFIKRQQELLESL